MFSEGTGGAYSHGEESGLKQGRHTYTTLSGKGEQGFGTTRGFGTTSTSADQTPSSHREMSFNAPLFPALQNRHLS